MIIFLFKYEWLVLKANKLIFLLSVISVFFTFFALYDGYERVCFHQNTLNQIEEQQSNDYSKYRLQIANAKPGQHFDGGHFGDPTNPFYFGNRMGAKYAVLKPTALSIISAGQSDIYPYYYKVTLSKMQALHHSEELENPRILFNGRFDMSFVIIFLLPLLIIAFSYNIFSSEKENGTLPLLMSQDTSVKKIIAYRFLFRYLLFNSFFTLLTILGLLSFGVKIGITLVELFTVLGIVWLYTAFWFALSYLVNCFKKSSAFTATTLIGIWLVLVMIIPVIISSVIDIVHPMPSKLELITNTRNVSDSITKNKNLINRFLEEHPEFKPAKADPKDQNPGRLRSRIELEMALEKVKSDFASTIAKREAIVSNYRFLSPAVFIQQLLNKISGTNDERYKDFDKSAMAFQQKFRNHFEPLVYRQEKFTVVDLDNVPNYLPPLTQNLISFDKKILMDVAYLTLLVLLILIFAQLRLKRN